VELPPYWLRRPGPEPDAATQAEFDALLAAALAAGPGTAIDYRLAAPKWQFLCHVADRGEAVLHGSSDPDIACFEPRQSNDIAEFGNRFYLPNARFTTPAEPTTTYDVVRIRIP